MPLNTFFLLTTLIPAALALRTIKIVNECQGTVWPALKGPNPTKSGMPQPYGWKQPSRTKYTFQVPDDCK
jgi:hypothetical protein